MRFDEDAGRAGVDGWSLKRAWAGLTALGFRRLALPVPLLIVVVGVTGGVAALAFQQARGLAAAPAPLMAYVPGGAMVSIESPDFAGLLRQWSESAESRAWLKSSNYAVFQNSRLFGRLGDAQSTYATAAGLTPDAAFLKRIAGKESVFAWYDVGKLEFLYITRMPAADASQTPLMEAKGSFERRHAGNAEFYIRPGSEAYQTVAFAQVASPSGDLLMLATREDLIANALKLVAGDATIAALPGEAWFQEVSVALPLEKSPPALHMAVNLDRAAHDPHFETYWIQRNVTWTRQYRASSADLYVERDMESRLFREERVLIPKAAPEGSSEVDVTPLAALAPPGVGVVRARATANPGDAIEAIREKLLGAYEATAPDPRYAPDPSLEAPQAGSVGDLEVRIDTVPPATAASTSEPLAEALRANGFDAMMTLSSARAPEDEAKLWVPIHSAVVLHAATAWNAEAFSSALQQMLRGGFTAGNLGIEFKRTAVGGHAMYALDGPKPLFFAVLATPAEGNVIVLADTQALLKQVLEDSGKAFEGGAAPAIAIAVFHHATERAPYARLASLVDGTNLDGRNRGDAPAFFSKNIESLSTAFAALESERVTERPVGPNFRQTVVYEWQR